MGFVGLSSATPGGMRLPGELMQKRTSLVISCHSASANINCRAQRAKMTSNWVDLPQGFMLLVVWLKGRH